MVLCTWLLLSLINAKGAKMKRIMTLFLISESLTAKNATVLVGIIVMFDDMQGDEKWHWVLKYNDSITKKKIGDFTALWN